MNGESLQLRENLRDKQLQEPMHVNCSLMRIARQVLERQTGVHRAALTLRYLDGLPVPEVARALGRTVHATEALLVRARAAFRRSYTALGEGGTR